MATGKSKWLWRAAGVAGILVGAALDMWLGNPWPYLAGMVLVLWVAATLSMLITARYLLAAPKHFMAAMVGGILMKMLAATAVVMVVVKVMEVKTWPAVATMLIAYFTYTFLEIRMLTRMAKSSNYSA